MRKLYLCPYCDKGNHAECSACNCDSAILALRSYARRWKALAKLLYFSRGEYRDAFRGKLEHTLEYVEKIRTALGATDKEDLLDAATRLRAEVERLNDRLDDYRAMLGDAHTSLRSCAARLPEDGSLWRRGLDYEIQGLDEFFRAVRQ